MAKKKPQKKKQVAKKKVVKRVAKPVSKKVSTVSARSNAVGIVPLGDRVLIKEIEAETESQTASGIYLPETAQKENKDSRKGKVVAVGEGRIENGARIPVSVTEGDIVVFSWGDSITVKGVEYYIVNEGNISAIIN